MHEIVGCTFTSEPSVSSRAVRQALLVTVLFPRTEARVVTVCAVDKEDHEGSWSTLRVARRISDIALRLMRRARVPAE
jgi:hypothetical protein